MTEERVVVALFNATWQSMALALAVEFALRMLQRTSASTRCAMWTAALLIAIALPVIDYGAAHSVAAPDQSDVTKPAVAILASYDLTVRAPKARAERSEPRSEVRSMSAPVMHVASSHAAVAQARLSLASLGLSLATILKSVAHDAFVLWCLGMTLFGLRFIYQVACLLAAKREVEPVKGLALTWGPRTRRAVRIGLSDRIAVPCLLGMVKPVIALPRALTCELSDTDLQRVVLHEAAHLQRGDDWFNLVEQLALVALFFNPAVHLIARRIEIEREIASDDLVIATVQNRITYAEFLTDLARRTASRQAVMVPGFFTNRRQIFVRIEQLLDRRHNGSSIIGRRAVLALGLLSVAALALAQIDIPVLAAACATTTTRAIVSRPPLPAVRRTISIVRVKITAVRTPRTSRAATAAVTPVSRYVKVAKALRLAAASRDVHPELVRTPAGDARSLQSAAARAVGQKAPFAARALVHVPQVIVLPQIRTSVVLQARAAALVSDAKIMAAVARAESGAQIAIAAVPHVDAMESANTESLSGYNGYGVDDVVQLHDNGVSASFILEMKRAGYSGLSAAQLIDLRNHGVSGVFARAMTGDGRHKVDVDALMRLCDHGVSAAYANALAASGLTGLSTDDLIALRDHGVSADYVAGLVRAGYRTLATADILRLYDNGVTLGYIQRVRHDLTSTHLTVDQLIRLRDSGL